MKKKYIKPGADTICLETESCVCSGSVIETEEKELIIKTGDYEDEENFKWSSNHDFSFE